MSAYPGSLHLDTILEFLHRHEAITRWPPDRSTIASSVVSFLFFCFLLAYLNLLPSALSRTLWGSIVFLIPTRLITALDEESKMASTKHAASGLSTLLDFRSKSEAMQRILGFGAGSLLPSLPGARRYSIGTSSFFGRDISNPPGLGNLSSSCYQNSIIQGLASLRSLVGFLDHNLEILGDRHTFATHVALKDVIQELNSTSNAGERLWIPRELKSMSSWQQQDAQEYFSKLVDQLDNEIRDASKGMTRDAGLKTVGSSQLSGHTLGTLPKDMKVQEVLEKLQCNSYGPPFVNPLEGLLAQRVGCMRCGWTEGLTMFQFNCLTVPLGRQYEYDLRQCLYDYTALELIEGVECPKCTLLRTETQLQRLLEQLGTETDSEDQGSKRTLTEALQATTESRLKAVVKALSEEDYSEKTLSGPCHIPRKNRVCSTKSKQAVIARAPKSLAIHVNRSMFDGLTGFSFKNGADVRFPMVFNLDPWCLGTKLGEGDDELESWVVDPSESMLQQPGASHEVSNNQRYELRAVVTHSGHHENGHYICYRKYPAESFPGKSTEDDLDEEDGEEKSEHWFMLSDANVYPVSESTVLAQGGVFMLFYELVDDIPQSIDTVSAMAFGDRTSAHVDSSNGNPFEGISNAPRKNATVGENQDPSEAGSSHTSDTLDLSSSSSTSSSEDSAEENMRQAVPHAGLVMRTSPTSSNARHGKSPSGMRSPVSSSIAAN